MNTKVLKTGGDFTVMAWMKPMTIGAGPFRVIVSELGTDNAAGEFILRITDTAGIQFFRRTGVGTSIQIVTTPSTLISVGQWYHIAAINSGGTLTLYINGTKAPVTQASGSWPGLSPTETLIGYWPTGGYFSGLIDEVHLFTQAITTAHVEQLYAEGLQGHQFVLEK